MRDAESPLLKLLPKEQVRDVMNQNMCELDYTFLGFTDIYEHLSYIIPIHFIILDLGCYVATQSFYFKNHKSYIGVDTITLKRFEFENTTHYIKSIQDFLLEDLQKYDLEKTFAICSYVPDDDAKRLVRAKFQNLFVFYPCSNELPF